MALKNKYQQEKQQYSNDGGITWYDVTPLTTRKGRLLETASEDCNTTLWREVQGAWFCVATGTIERWVTVPNEYECVAHNKWTKEKKQLSSDGGTTWVDSSPLETRAGTLIETDSTDCGYEPPRTYRWVEVPNEYMCSGTTKCTKEKQQYSTDGGTTWTDVSPANYRSGNIIEYNSLDCGFEDYTVFDCGIVFTDLNSNDHWFSTNDGARFELINTEVNNINGYIRVNFKIHIKKNMTNYDWAVRKDGGTMAAHHYIGDVVAGDVINDYFEVPCGYYNFMLQIQQWVVQYGTVLRYAQSHLVSLCNDCVSPPSYQYRWVTDNTDYLCNCTDKYSLERQQFSSDNGETWWYSGKERQGTLIEADSVDCGYGYPNQYLTIVFLDEGRVRENNYNSFEYSIDDGTTWTSVGQTPIVSSGTIMLLKGTRTEYSFSVIDGNNNKCRFNVEGNIMSLRFGDNFQNKTTVDDSCFSGLFKQTKVVNAENLILPATTLGESCYSTMFRDCTSLTKAPKKLPASTLKRRCYGAMFEGCTSLTTAPQISATTLAERCCENMFYHCESLTTAPNLSALSLVNRCYYMMFAYCNNLYYIKAMFLDDPSDGTYTQQWLYNVASSGTFVKNAGASWTHRGYNGIPRNWTVQTASN